MPPQADEVKEMIKDISIVAPLLKNEKIAINRLLQLGGQGVVYLGMYVSQTVAIKIYFPGQIERRIEREVNALNRLDCQSIVKLLWHGQISVYGYPVKVVVTEYIDGEPLDAVIRKRNLSEDEVGVLLYDISKAISNMWVQRIVHRDIKPSNIILRENRRFCLIDLGLARHLEESTLTALGVTWGTRGYLSPEQMKAVKQLSCKSDIFSLGIVAIESSLGSHPSNKDQFQLLSLTLNKLLPNPVNQWNYSRLIMKMFEIQPNLRPLPSEICDQLSKYNNN